ncbi:MULTISPECIES: MerR family transcriptional regulator [Streptomyces]|uniref:Transcriptional regulator, MerR family n=1 Tax=Streptomyces venezuelae (strain ATCC 10712 / CBS 650.69 / DSM 40230 / JCM 4526 / NBRC 13096 / PD 04745) TaxID=953739 RepID=F2R8X5_STRVP|nr:MerR family transcriptional regulator [Streptomyces venezuelae]APE22281.1 MerR family transcriptional regulator [Streptomyces venezuelae]QER99664.1 MerR family transcriptional regulator [Streptomyces venezuelae ATCC 10712]QES14574.1 MerR family transcriptional regulator [Streptomyces venezuelae]CCA56435.1 Transcriptional regulator, MerR family [Streptomyces venezuelae ATCC 10712]
MAGEPMQIAEVAARTELSLRTIRQYEDNGLVVPSAASPGGFPLYTDADVSRLMVVRRMKPLGFTLDETRELLTAVDRLAAERAGTETELEPDERATLVARVQGYERAAAERVAELRAQLSRAEEFAESLRHTRLTATPA